MKEIIQRILEQNKKNEIFNHDDALTIAQMILDEAHELVQAVEMAYLNDDLTEVASECADTFYLLIRMFNAIGIDERAVEMKIARNDDKYKNQPNIETAKTEWEKRGGDKSFFEHYDG